ncbi:efflux RND transporter periplasmic adaptor subunit [Stakelama marina]|uniref:Efflux RND transporter periplasmic adaptor subunit n=1 Tax=Stakelama marina TaxID=2826939 RepID=A0A8T4IB03_9SPHN|nr:efflux RND transporter periplasmic adaptor subunit [Stakelama marina]MBR0551282.1 efflux RND transporter periplasmic adaptor subunit [Stakelama marina]
MRFGGSITAALLLAMPLAACGGGEQEAATTQKAPAGPRLTLQQTQVANWREVPAEVATVDQAQALARIPGILTSLSVNAGDWVKRGQTIGRIVDSQLGPKAGAYGAQAAAAEAQAAQARAELERVRFLYNNGVYAKAKLDQAKAAADAAQAQVRAAKAQQAAVGAVAGQGVVSAPATGRVLKADIPAGSPVSPGMAIATITAGPTILRLQMPETLADEVHNGSRVRATGIGDGERTGTVVKVYPSVQSGQMTADVSMPGIDGSLIGRRVPAKVESGTRKAVLVPDSFVIHRYGIDYVTVLAKDGSASTVPVQTAPSAEKGKVEILSGVGAGDTLIGAQSK